MSSFLIFMCQLHVHDLYKSLFSKNIALMELNGMGHTWPKIGSDMGRTMVHICLLCGFDMGYSPTYQTHRCLSLSLCCLLLWDEYIFRIKGPYILHSFLLGNGMGVPHSNNI